jgi:hypothetical protein
MTIIHSIFRSNYTEPQLPTRRQAWDKKHSPDHRDKILHLALKSPFLRILRQYSTPSLFRNFVGYCLIQRSLCSPELPGPTDPSPEGLAYGGRASQYSLTSVCYRMFRTLSSNESNLEFSIASKQGISECNTKLLTLLPHLIQSQYSTREEIRLVSGDTSDMFE